MREKHFFMGSPSFFCGWKWMLVQPKYTTASLQNLSKEGGESWADDILGLGFWRKIVYNKDEKAEWTKDLRPMKME